MNKRYANIILLIVCVVILSAGGIVLKRMYRKEVSMPAPPDVSVAGSAESPILKNIENPVAQKSDGAPTPSLPAPRSRKPKVDDLRKSFTSTPHPRKQEIDDLRETLVSVARLNEKQASVAAIAKHRKNNSGAGGLCHDTQPNTCLIGEVADEPDTDKYYQWSCIGANDSGNMGCLIPRASVKFKKNTVYYNGNIERSGYEDFLSAVQSRDTPVTKLVITSDGGPTDIGKLFGLWVHENNIDVQVRELCFSSCANYVFTAGRNKYIEENALVGWHGTPIFLHGNSDSSDAERVRAAEESFRRLAAEDGVSDIETVVKDGVLSYTLELESEHTFYNLIGVDPLITSFFGQTEYKGRKVRPSAHQKEIEQAFNRTGNLTQVTGDTFSIKNMARFGVRNVTYLGTRQVSGTENNERRGCDT